MLEALVSSKTRIKLLLKFFLNSDTVAYLRGLETEFQESSNGIRIELNRMEDAGLLETFSRGNKKMFRANRRHPLYSEIHNILLKHIGLDQVIGQVVDKLGDVQEVYLIGDFAKGMDSPVIDLVLVGDIDKSFLVELIEKAERLVERKMRFLTYEIAEFEVYRKEFSQKPNFLLWSDSID